MIEIAVFIPLLLLAVGRGGRYLLKKAEDDEPAYFVLMFGVMAAAVALTQIVQLPDIVGAFLAGLAVNTAVQQRPAKEKLEFIGNSFFIPIFFVVTGFLIDPIAFVRSIVDNAGLAAAVVGALIVGKGIVNAGGERLLDQKILDVVFVLILVTATLGPIMTQRYAPLMLASSEGRLLKKSA